MSNTTYIIVLAILVFFSAFFSATETAFSTLNRIKLKYLSNNGDKKAEKTLAIVDNFSKFISTVLVGNNIVNIVSATLATVLFTRLVGDNAALVSSIVMTIIVIIFGEVCPKRIAKMHPEDFAMAITPFLSFLMFILTPLTIIFDSIGTLAEKLFKSEKDDDYNSEELVTMIEEAEEQGDMDENEADLITNAIEFNDLDVGEIYTPRVDVVAVTAYDSNDDIDQKFRETGYSRLPYYKESIDNITGVIHEKDFYQIYFKKSNKTIDDILQKVVYTNENVKISNVLRQLQSAKTHMAIVVDEYGGTQGIITMEDILEELVGEIYDEHDEIIEYFTKVNDKEYKVNCDAEIEDFFEYFNIESENDDYDYNTVSGFIIDEFDCIPKINDQIIYKNLKIIVIDADEKEVKELKITILDDDNNSNED